MRYTPKMRNMIEAFTWDFDARDVEDLTANQKRGICKEYIKAQSPEVLLESLLEASTPEELPQILSDLFVSSDDAREGIVNRLVKLMNSTVLNYYETDISEKLSDCHWKRIEADRNAYASPISVSGRTSFNDFFEDLNKYVDCALGSNFM